MKTSFFRFCCALTLATLLSGCNFSFDTNYQFIPFQEQQDGRWGMISPDGKVLCKEEFTNVPTPATCDRFWVENAQGYYELYSTDKQPKQIGEEFSSISMFYKGKAFATPRNGEISVINRKGEVVRTVQTIDGKEISYLSNINEGHAVAQTDTLQGVIDFKGDWVIEPTEKIFNTMYDGYIIAQDPLFYYAAHLSQADAKKEKIKEQFMYLYDKNGEEVLKLSSNQYNDASQRCYGNYLPVAKKSGDKVAWGILDLKGETVVDCSNKYANILEVQNDMFIYRDEDGNCGVKKIDGTSIITPSKYTHIAFAGKDTFLAQSADQSDNEWQYLSIDGTPLSNKKYRQASLFIPSADKYAFVELELNQWKIINNNGETLADTPNMYNISMNLQPSVLSTDKVDIDKFIQKINLSAQSLDSLTFSSSIQNVIKRQNRYFSIDNAPKAANYTSTDKIDIYRDINGIPFTEIIGFPGFLAKQTYSNKECIDYYDWYYDYYVYHYEKVPTGVVWNSYTPSYFGLEFNNYGVFRGKLRSLYNAFTDYFAKIGSKIDSNSSASLYSLSNNHKALIYLKEDGVVVKWGAIGDTASDLYRYDGVKEKLRSKSNEIIAYTNSPLFPLYQDEMSEGD